MSISCGSASLGCANDFLHLSQGGGIVTLRAEVAKLQDNFPEHLQRWMSMLSVTLWKVEWAKSWGDPDFMQVLTSIFFSFSFTALLLSYYVVHTVQMRELLAVSIHIIRQLRLHLIPPLGVRFRWSSVRKHPSPLEWWLLRKPRRRARSRRHRQLPVLPWMRTRK